MTRWPLLVVIAALLGCPPAERDSDLALALTRARPYLDQLRGFETWVLRASSVSDPKLSAHARAETLFAPLRNDRRVLAAWIDLDGKPEAQLSLPPDNPWPAIDDWTRVNEATFGWIRVARHAQCPIEAPRHWRKEAGRECVMLARDTATTTTPRVAMAFVETE